MSKEMLDVVNKQDITIDQQPRGKVHRLGLWHRGAHVFLFAPDGKLLVQKRSADRVHAPSLLDCSVSEHVQAGESYLQAAHRGLKEEMGVEGITLKELYKFRMNYGVNDNEISVLYEGRVDPRQVQFDPVEIDSIQYLRLDELQKLLDEDGEKLCFWFIQLLNLYLHGKGEMEKLE